MNVDDILACPSCKAPSISVQGSEYSCASCGESYPSRDGIAVFLSRNSKIIAEEADRADFWNAGWEKRNSHLLSMDCEDILEERQNYINYLSKEGYPSVADLSTDNVGNKIFLNIGCGGGYEGLLFSGYGTQYIGVDFSYNAVNYTKNIIEKAGFNGVTFQAEAETLPFQDNSIDFVYSSGVLPHTPNPAQTLKEVCRVLKPNGRAMIGLYATYSFMFVWYRLHAVLHGNFTKSSVEEWMNSNTEGEWQTNGRENKWTKTFTKPEFAEMMRTAGFSQIHVKQTPQQIKTIPIIGKTISTLISEKISDLRIGPFGGMLIATCTKMSDQD